MILIRPSSQILAYTPDALTLIEKAGRVCYKSEDKITSYSTDKFIRRIIKEGHHSVLEHASMTVRIICDRGVSHEIVRHRLCAYSQESTRYCNYKGGVTFIIPPWVSIKPDTYNTIDECHATYYDIPWASSMLEAEKTYILLLKQGWTPQQARSVLPNSLKTEIVMTANFREWRHIFELRAEGKTGKPHPQMAEIMEKLLFKTYTLFPPVFADIMGRIVI